MPNLGISYSEALEDEFSDPFSAIYEAGSQAWDDLFSGNAGDDLLQNAGFGSVSASQKSDITNQCIQGVENAGGTDTGQCASLINDALNQANAQPVSNPLLKLSGIMIAVIAVGAFVVLDLVD